MIELRDYQEQAIIDIKRSMTQGHKRVILQIVCSGGKTRIAAAIIERALEKNKKIMFIADRITLVEQTATEFSKLGLDYGIIMADHPMYAPWKPLQIVSSQTLANRTPPDSDLVIVDEASSHYKHISKLMETWSLVPFIGLDGTPYSTGLGNFYSKIIQGPSALELIGKGYLVPPICYGIDSIDLTGLKTQGNDWHKKELEKRARKPKITADIVNTWLDKGEGRITIMFPTSVAHSKELVNEFNQSGVPACHIDAHTKVEVRNEYFDKLRSGEITILSSVGCLVKGFSIEEISCVILAYSTKSIIKYIQSVWRAGRACEKIGKKDFIILDHGQNIARLGWCTDDLPNELCNGDKSEAQRVKDEIEKKEEKEQLPKKCPQCDFLVEPKIFTCPKCGYIFAKTSDVEVEAGELKKLERKKATPAEKRNKTISKEDKQAFYSAALAHCLNKNYKEGWAAQKYRDYFGVWPNAIGKVAGGESMLFSSYLTSSNIRYARSQAKLVG